MSRRNTRGELPSPSTLHMDARLDQHPVNTLPGTAMPTTHLGRNNSNTSITSITSANGTTLTTTSTAPKKTAFVQKLYNMLSDPKLAHLIWWSRGDSDGVFALHPCTEFATALTTYFKHGNVSSFVRQLHMYGFHKVFDTYNEDHPPATSTSRGSDDLVWEFRHSTGAFRKGDEESLSLIKRRSSNRVVPDEQLRLSDFPPAPLHHQQHAHMGLAPPQQGQPQYYYPVVHPIPGTVIHYALPQASEHYPHQIQQIHPHQMQQVVYVTEPQHQHPPQSHTPQPLPQHPMDSRSSTSSTPMSQSRSLQPLLPSYPQQQPQQQQHQPQQPQQQQQEPAPYTQTYPQLPQQHHQSQSQLQSLRQGSTAIPPEQNTILSATQDIAAQQREIHSRAETVTELQRSTVGDVLKIGEQLPKIAPSLKKEGHRYAETLGQLQQSFNKRAESLTPEPQPEPQQPQQQAQQQVQVQVQQSQRLPQPHQVVHQAQQQHFMSQNPGTAMVNPFTQGAAQRAQSIHFWERSSVRQPSVFVDPLNPVPQHHHHIASPLSSSPSSPSQSAGSSQRSSTVSVNAHPSHFPTQHPLAYQQQQQQYETAHHLHQQIQQGRNATSVPHIQYTPGSPTAQGPQRRTDSLPTHFQLPPSAQYPPPPPPPALAPPSSAQRQYPPRSVPEDHQQTHYSHPSQHQLLQQQQQVQQGRSSIPGIAHLNSRLRPSLLEFYNNNPTHQYPQQQQQTTSMSSNSTYSTLYSAQSSISSISTRNSQGSFSGIAHDALSAHRALEHQPVPGSPGSGAGSRRSMNTVVDDKSGSSISTPSISKVAVSSLLSSPGSRDEEKKRPSTDDGSLNSNGLKRVKSTSNLR